MTPEAIKRRAEALESVGEPHSMGSWFVPYLGGNPDRPEHEQIEAFLCESLHCALTHREPLIILRAWGQACDYVAQLRGKISIGGYSDALLTARNRLENLLRPCDRFPE